MAKFRGFNNSIISVKRRKLNRTQIRQVQKVVNANKRLKNYYVPINHSFTNSGAVGNYIGITELTSVGINGPDATVRQTSEILLQSYNIKLGMVPHDDGLNPIYMWPASYRIIIARSKQGPATDISSQTGPITNFTDQPDPDVYQVYADEIHTAGGGTASGAVLARSNPSLGYLMHMYKSFKNKKVPHMVVGYNDTTATPDATTANNNPILMKIIVDPAFSGDEAEFNFQLKGFGHIKFFDKE